MKVRVLLQVLFLLLCTSPTLFAQFPVNCIDYANVYGPGGASQIVTCEGDGIAESYNFGTSTLAMPFGFLITDENNIILQVSIDNTLSFEGLGEGSFRVYAFSYIGQITAQPGQNATTTQLGSICGELTTNFIPVSNFVPNGGTIATENGNTSAFICLDDSVDDNIDFMTTGDQSIGYAYLITDETNIIVDIANGNTYDFANLSVGTYRVWGVSYAGNLTAQIGDDAATANLADDCYGLSDNYVEVTIAQPDGASVALANGMDQITVCVADNIADELVFTNQSTVNAAYTYIVTDENNVILAIVNGDSFDFESASPGTCRVWGVSFTGNFTAMVDDDATAVALSDGCYDLSENYIEVIRQAAIGGMVVLEDGTTETFACVGDGDADEFSFASTGADADDYVFLITDENNMVLAINDSGSFDFEGAPTGVCRIWGLAYNGTLLVEAGDDAANAILADGCFGLSENFITVRRESVEGGTVAMPNGGTIRYTCPGDGQADIVEFTNTGSTTGAYAYVITDEDLNILEVTAAASFDFDGAPAGTCLVWGLAYTGNLAATLGADASAIALSDECYDLSDDYITVVRETPEGGTVAMPNGETIHYTCPGDGVADIVMFDSTGTFSGPYTYVITDENNVILGFPTADSFDFDGAPAGTCRVWGLAYTGNLTAMVDDTASVVALSDDCYDLSDNFITVVRETPEGGTVATADGETTRLICPGDGLEDIVLFDSAGTSSGPYAYVITDENNVILGFPADDSFDFDGAPAGICRVWGLAYTGSLTAMVDDTASVVALSDDCYDLSDNFITIIRQTPVGGNISFDDGSNLQFTCPNGVADVLSFEAADTTGPSYTYLITDEQNIVLDLAPNGDYDFDTAPIGICRVWGLAYSGTLTTEVGDTASISVLSTDCYNISENFLAVIKQEPDGGTVSTELGETLVYTCPGDGVADIIEFDSAGITITPYTYIITDENNVILEFVDEGSFNFDGAPAGTCRVWGLAYTGDIVAVMGDTASVVNISDDCFDLSDNFITVVRDVPNAGDVTMENGSNNVFLCSDPGAEGTVSFDSTGTSNSPYTYIVTDQTNLILDFITGDSYDFSSLSAGTYHVWGIAYTGDLLAAIGDDASAAVLSNDCYDLSDSFVEVVNQPTDGGTVSTIDGETEVQICPGDGMDDIIEFVNTGLGANYVYVITNENEVILTITQDDAINFDIAGIGVSHIWGLAYTGNLQIMQGDTLMGMDLSDDCYDLSDNFVTVVSEVPDAGSIATEEGTELVYTCPGDGIADVVAFDSSGVIGTYTYIITDENNEILGFPTGDSFDFDGAPAGTCRVWGLAYSGNLLAMQGDIASAAVLSDDCYDLSDNFITVVRMQPDGGTVSTATGDMEVTICPGNGDADVIAFNNSGAVGLYSYVITDTNNVILDFVVGGEHDFDSAPEGVCRVWGLAYTGNITAMAGDTASIATLSDDCYDLSDNYVTIIRQSPEGGNITSTAGSVVDICVGDSNPDSIFFVVDGASSNDYIYLIADSNAILIGAVTDPYFEFDNASSGVYHIYGLSYTGLPNLLPGTDLTEVDLSNDCFDLSDDFIRVNATGVDGAIVYTSEGVGVELIYLCVGDGEEDIISFIPTTTESDANYVYAITNEDGIVLGFIPPSNEFDFEIAGVGTAVVVGVSYTGNLTFNVGMDIYNTVLSDGCYDLSDNTVTIVRDQPEGGLITTDDGSTDLLLCVGPANSDVTMVSSSSSIVGYAYILTSPDDVVLAVYDDATIDFTQWPIGDYKIWGLSYTGMLNDLVGENILMVEPATDCYELSQNAVGVSRGPGVDGGSVSTVFDQDIFYTCTTDDVFDIIPMITTSADTTYTYIITDGNDQVIVADVEESVIPFEGAPAGIYHIWGLSYYGNLELGFGDNVLSTPASDSCFAYSDNFVTVVRDTPEGGTVLTNEGADAIIVVVGDTIPDEYTFVHFDASDLLPYTYVITDTNNVIINISSDPVIDFEGADPGVCRIWGMSYTGDITAMAGDTATTIAMTNDCWSFSNNFVTVTREEDMGLQDEENELFSNADEVIQKIKIAPNPATEYTIITFELSEQASANSTLQILDGRGQMIEAVKVASRAGTNQYELSITDWSGGMYVAFLRNGKEIKAKKFVVLKL